MNVFEKVEYITKETPYYERDRVSFGRIVHYAILVKLCKPRQKGRMDK
jgi:hypothetical protein